MDQSSEEQQVLGIRWNCTTYQLIFDIKDISQLMKEMRPTKRNAVSLVTQIHGPLGFLSPITVQLKLLSQCN